MPIFESACIQTACPYSGRPVEWIGKYDDLDPLCGCGQRMERQVSRFGVVWTGPITQKYKDPSKEGYHGDGGHWVYRTKDTKSGKPEPMYIETFQQQKEFCKAEGLALPSDTSDAKISSDGRSVTRISKAEVRDLREEDHHAVAQSTKVE